MQVPENAQTVFQHASLQVLCDKVSIRRAASNFGLSHATLYRYLKKHTSYVQKKKLNNQI